jgi:hypothetical protein
MPVLSPTFGEHRAAYWDGYLETFEIKALSKRRHSISQIEQHIIKPNRP